MICFITNASNNNRWIVYQTFVQNTFLGFLTRHHVIHKQIKLYTVLIRGITKTLSQLSRSPSHVSCFWCLSMINNRKCYNIYEYVCKFDTSGINAFTSSFLSMHFLSIIKKADVESSRWKIETVFKAKSSRFQEQNASYFSKCVNHKC